MNDKDLSEGHRSGGLTKEEHLRSATSVLNTVSQNDAHHGFGTAWLNYSKQEESFARSLRELMHNAWPLVDEMVKKLTVRGAIKFVIKIAINEGKKDSRWFLLCLAFLAIICVVAAFNHLEVGQFFGLFLRLVAPTIDASGGWIAILGLVGAGIKYLLETGEKLLPLVKALMQSKTFIK